MTDEYGRFCFFGEESSFFSLDELVRAARFNTMFFKDDYNASNDEKIFDVCKILKVYSDIEEFIYDNLENII